MERDLAQDEKREFRRVNVELKGSYRVLEKERSEGCAEIQNLSHSGLMFIASSVLIRGDAIEMTVYFDEYEIPFSAKVVWLEKLYGSLPEENKYGVKYTRISPLEQSHLALIISSHLKSE